MHVGNFRLIKNDSLGELTCRRAVVVSERNVATVGVTLHNRRESRSRQFCTWREIWAAVVTSCLGRSLNPAAPAPPPTEYMCSDCCVLITHARARTSRLHVICRNRIKKIYQLFVYLYLHYFYLPVRRLLDFQTDW